MFDASTTQTNLNTVANAGLTVDGQAGAKTFLALLERAAGRVSPLMPTLAALLATKLEEHGINTPLRVRHFLAQACCETDHFNTLVEYGGASYFAKYDGRRDLGNIQPGDGPRFKGRGLLQTTGRANYSALAKATGLDCVNHPELLQDPTNAVEAACLFWVARGVNAAADAADIKRVTLLINGGYNGLSDRMSFYERLGVIA